MDANHATQAYFEIGHRKQFNLESFGTTTFEQGDNVVFSAGTKKTRKKIMTKQEYDDLMRLVRYCDVVEGHVDPKTGVHITQKELRKSCKIKGWTNNRYHYRLETSMTPDGGQVHRLEFNYGKTGDWKTLLHQAMVFEVIKECHTAVGHKRIKVT